MENNISRDEVRRGTVIEVFIPDMVAKSMDTIIEIFHKEMAEKLMEVYSQKIIADFKFQIVSIIEKCGADVVARGVKSVVKDLMNEEKNEN